jgi:dTDP-glucose pyrophosphorylase
MKIITVAAGDGTRLASASALASGDILPKPLFLAKGRPLINWSYKSFNRWITSGLVKPSDFIFVIRAEHEEKFNMVENIKDLTHPEVNFVVLDRLTSGPAESAYFVIKNLVRTESFVVNDCDHYFNASSMLEELLENQSNYIGEDLIRLSFTKPNSQLANWSYVSLGNKYSSRSYSVGKVVEKDLNFENLQNGLIGCYFFSSAKFYSELYKKLTDTNGEKYISKLIDIALKEKKIVTASAGKFGFPLGTEDDINEFENIMNTKSELSFKDRTYFIDIDGVVLKHDSGFHSLSEEFSENQEGIFTNINQIKERYYLGDKIILTTSRPESKREELISFLQQNDFYFSELIMGITDGIRYLINDRKKTDSYLDTAIAVNVVRDKPYDLINDKVFHNGVEVKANLSAGSGASTLVLKNSGSKKIIRKTVYQPNENLVSATVLNIQKEWYEAASSLIPNNIPRVYGYEYTNSFANLDLEYISPSLSLAQVAKGVGDVWGEQNSHNEIQFKVCESLIEVLGELYRKSAIINPRTRTIDLKKFILNKSIPGIQSLYSSSDFLPFEFLRKKNVSINGQNFMNPITSLQEIEYKTNQNSFSKSGLYSKFDVQIHGDLTAENILITNDLNIFLIDPLSTFMDSPKIINGSLTSNKTSISFDFIKILQSFHCGYENWSNNHLTSLLSKNGEIWFDSDLYQANSNFPYHELLHFFKEFGVDISSQNTDLLAALMLFRLIPYRLKVNKASAIYCFCLGTLLLERLS